MQITVRVLSGYCIRVLWIVYIPVSGLDVLRIFPRVISYGSNHDFKTFLEKN